MAYSSHISWQDANSPVPMEVYPSLAFDSLFDNQESRRTISILTRVKEQTAALHHHVSHADRAKLDEYLTRVRQIEKRIGVSRAAQDRAEDRKPSGSAIPQCHSLDYDPPSARRTISLSAEQFLQPVLRLFFQLAV